LRRKVALARRRTPRPAPSSACSSQPAWARVASPPCPGSIGVQALSGSARRRGSPLDIGPDAVGAASASILRLRATLRYRAGGGRRRRQFDPRSPRSSCRTAAGAGRLRSDIHQRSSPAGGFRYNLVWDGRSDGASKIERHRVKKTNGQHCIIAYNSFKCHIYRIKTNRI